MQLLLKAAKFAALCEGDSEIRLKHLARVLPGLHPVDEGIERWLARKLGPSELPPIPLSNTLIRQAGEEPPLPWSREVAGLITELASEGCSIKDLCFLTEQDVAPHTTPNPLKSFLETFSPSRNPQRSSDTKAKRQDNEKKQTQPQEPSSEDRPIPGAAPTRDYIDRRLGEIQDIEATLNHALKGQETTNRLFCDELRFRILGNTDATGKVNAFFLIGPANTGKSLFVESLADFYSGRPMKIFNMSQYDSALEAMGLTGLRRGYRDAHEGSLTSFAKQNPDGIIVFDHIDQAHTAVQAQLKELFSAGKIEDSYTEETVNFSRNLIFLTSRGSRSFFSSPTQTALIHSNPGVASTALLDAMMDESRLQKQVSEFGKGLSPDLFEAATAIPVLIFQKLGFGAMCTILAEDFAGLTDEIKRYFGVTLIAKSETVAQMWLARSSPDFDLKEARANLSRELLGLFMADHHRLSDTQVTLSSEFELRNVARANGFEFTSIDEFLHGLKRQSRTLSFSLNVSDGSAPLLQAKDCTIQKLSAAQDFEGALGLSAHIPEVSFEQIAGHGAAKNRLISLIDILSGQNEETRNLELPKGIILHGPPGTGKTMLAKATANHAGLPFIPVTGNDLLEEDNILRVFELAREYAPSLVFIDEIDALPKRGEAGHRVDWVINRLLTEIDGFRTPGDARVMIMAATNRLETLDSALIRSGRLELHVHIGQLDRDARRWFLEKVLEDLPSTPDVKIDELIALTVGMTGADINRLKREALFKLADSEHKVVDGPWLTRLIREQRYGKPLGNKNLPDLLKESALHQMAKAVVSKILLPQREIDFISMVARERQDAGVTFTGRSSYELTAQVLQAQAASLLAGRLAQQRCFGESGVDESAEPDFEQATRLAHQAVTRFGMSSRLAPVHWPTLNQLSKSAALPQSVIDELSQWLENAAELSRQTLDNCWDHVLFLAEELERKEMMSGTELEEGLKTEPYISSF